MVFSHAWSLSSFAYLWINWSTTLCSLRALLHCFLPGLVNIPSCFLLSNLILLMWAYSFVDLYCIVVHAFEQVLAERDSFILDHVIELFPWPNNILMIMWLNFDAYIPHLDSPLIILASFGCPWCGPSCFILARLHIILFLNPMNGIPNDTFSLVHEPSVMSLLKYICNKVLLHNFAQFWLRKRTHHFWLRDLGGNLT